MGCKHINDYVRAILKINGIYNGLPDSYWSECPWCVLEDQRTSKKGQNNSVLTDVQIYCGVCNYPMIICR